MHSSNLNWCCMLSHSTNFQHQFKFDECILTQTIHTHANPGGRLKRSYTRWTAYFMCGLMSDTVNCKFRKKYGYKNMVIHDQMSWDQMSLTNTNQTRDTANSKVNNISLLFTYMSDFPWSICRLAHPESITLLYWISCECLLHVMDEGLLSVQKDEWHSMLMSHCPFWSRVYHDVLNILWMFMSHSPWLY